MQVFHAPHFPFGNAVVNFITPSDLLHTSDPGGAGSPSHDTARQSSGEFSQTETGLVIIRGYLQVFTWLLLRFGSLL